MVYPREEYKEEISEPEASMPRSVKTPILSPAAKTPTNEPGPDPVYKRTETEISQALKSPPAVQHDKMNNSNTQVPQNATKDKARLERSNRLKETIAAALDPLEPESGRFLS